MFAWFYFEKSRVLGYAPINTKPVGEGGRAKVGDFEIFYKKKTIQTPRPGANFDCEGFQPSQ